MRVTIPSRWPRWRLSPGSGRSRRRRPASPGRAAVGELGVRCSDGRGLATWARRRQLPASAWCRACPRRTTWPPPAIRPPLLPRAVRRTGAGPSLSWKLRAGRGDGRRAPADRRPRRSGRLPPPRGGGGPHAEPAPRGSRPAGRARGRPRHSGRGRRAPTPARPVPAPAPREWRPATAAPIRGPGGPGSRRTPPAGWPAHAPTPHAGRPAPATRTPGGIGARQLGEAAPAPGGVEEPPRIEGVQVLVGAHPDEEVTGQADALELQAEASPDLDHHHRQRDRDAGAALEHLIQQRVAGIVIAPAITGESDRLEQVAAQIAERWPAAALGQGIELVPAGGHHRGGIGPRVGVGGDQQAPLVQDRWRPPGPWIRAMNRSVASTYPGRRPRHPFEHHPGSVAVDLAPPTLLKQRPGQHPRLGPQHGVHPVAVEGPAPPPPPPPPTRTPAVRSPTGGRVRMSMYRSSMNTFVEGPARQIRKQPTTSTAAIRWRHGEPAGPVQERASGEPPGTHRGARSGGRGARTTRPAVTPTAATTAATRTITEPLDPDHRLGPVLHPLPPGGGPAGQPGGPVQPAGPARRRRQRRGQDDAERGPGSARPPTRGRGTRTREAAGPRATGPAAARRAPA